MYYTANLFIAFTQNFHYIIIIIILDIFKKKRTCISSSLLGQMKSVLGHWKSKLGVVYFYKKSLFYTAWIEFY